MKQNDSLHPVPRTALAMAAFFAAFFLIAFPGLGLMGDRHLPLSVLLIGAGAIAVCVWVYAGNKPRLARMARYTFIGGTILGGIGFVVGFIGPMIFAPQANQGPLLGIFITGPLGFVIGAVFGFIFALVKRS